MDTQQFSNASLTPEQRLIRLLRVELEQEGADPSRWLDVLASAIEKKAWEAVGLPDFATFVVSDEGMGSSVAEVETLVSLRHRHEDIHVPMAARMATLRQNVRDLLHEPLSNHGTNQHGGGLRITKSSDDTDDASYVLSRLKRDDPSLAKQVIQGDVSAHRAAVQSGIRKARWSAPTDPAALARAIRRRFTDDEWDAFADAVGEIT